MAMKTMNDQSSTEADDPEAHACSSLEAHSRREFIAGAAATGVTLLLPGFVSATV